MKRRYNLCLVLLLAVMLVMTGLSVSASDVIKSGSFGENVVYTLYSNGSLVIEGEGTVSTYNEPDLESIKNACTSIEIKEGITGVEGEAFYAWPYVESVVLPGTLTEIGDYVFSGCESLAKIELKEGINRIGHGMFSGSVLTSVDLPSTIRTIGDYAFSRCPDLSQVNLNEGLEEIGHRAFENWAYGNTPKLKSIVIPSTVTAIRSEAFSNSDISEVYFSGKPLELTEEIFYNDVSEGRALKAYYPKEKNWTQEDLIFLGIDTLWIPYTLDENGNRVFDEENACQVGIPTSGEIGDGGHWWIDVDNVLHVGGTAEIGYGRKFEQWWKNVSGVIVENGVVTFEHSFDHCENLTFVKFGEDYRGGCSFSYCEALVEVKFNEGIEMLTGFEGCTAMKEIEVPSTVSSIEMNAFAYCTGLESVTFKGGKPENIGWHAFYKGVSEMMVYYPENGAGWNELPGEEQFCCTTIWTPYTLDANGNKVCNTTNAITTFGIVATAGGANYSYNLYSNGVAKIEGTGRVGNSEHWFDRDPLWSGMTRLEIGEGITALGDGAVYDRTNAVITIEFPTTLTTIEAYAFSRYSNIKDLDLRCVTEIGEYAFLDSSLETVILSEQLKEIPYGAFRNSKLQSIHIPGSVEVIGEYAFYECVDLEIITIDEGCESIGGYAFAETGIIQMVMPGSITSIGENIFSDCSKLKYCVFSEGITHVPNECFYGLDNLESVVLPDTVVSIGSDAFLYCRNLKNIRLSKNLLEIKTQAFRDCESLEEIEIPASVTTIGSCAFYNCISLKKVVFNEGLQYICDGAFYNSGIQEAILPESVLDIGYGDENGDDSGLGAFEKCPNLKKVKLSSKIDTIPWGCFAKSGSGEFIMSDSVTTIKPFAFYECGFKSITLSNSITEIPACFFAYSELENVKLPENLSVIGEYAFAGSKLKSVVIPESVKLIEVGSFDYCKSLRTAVFEGSCPEIEGYIFYCNGIGTIAYLLEEYESSFEEIFSRIPTTTGIYTVDEEGIYYLDADMLDDSYLHSILNHSLRVQYPEGYPLDQYSVSVLNTTEWVGYGSQAFAYILSDHIFGTYPVDVDDSVSFEELKLGDILRLDNDTRSVVVTQINEDSVLVVQGNWIDDSTEDGESTGTVHWDIVLTREQVEAADYRISRYKTILFEEVPEVNNPVPEFPPLPTEIPTEEEAQQIILEQKKSFPHGLSYTIEVTYDTVAEVLDPQINREGNGCSAFAFYLSDLCFGTAPMRCVTDIQFEDIKVGDILHYKPYEDSAYTHVVVVVEVYKDRVVIADANSNFAVRWGEVFMDYEVEGMLEYWTRYPEGTVVGERPEYKEEEVHTHSYQVTVHGSTCTEAGYSSFICAGCGDSFVANFKDALGHKLGEWIVIKEAECGQVGMQHRQCERCELSEQEEIPALTHSFTNIQITAPGEEKAFCECGEYEVSYITGWILYNGVYYYRLNDENHTLVMEDTIIDNAISEFDENGVWKGYAKAGWKQLEGDWYYLSNGGRINIGWKLLGSTWYYFDEAGVMVTGWQEIDGADYFFHAGGGMAKGWVQDGSIWYYMNSSGRKIRENTVIDGCLNLFDENGVWLGYAAAGWRQDGEDWYYLGSGGKITKGWKLLGSTWYYFDASGIMQTGWLQLGSTWYYLNSSGGMVTGSVVIDGAMNEFNGSGVWLGYAKAGWKQVGSKWYYLGSGGKIIKGWKLLGSTWYYFDASGIMQTGWLQLGSTWYYLNSSGAMATGWLKIGGTWYYLNNSGAMVTGWNKIGSATYYFTASGAMVTGSRVIDGVSYQFNGSGALVGTR